MAMMPVSKKIFVRLTKGLVTALDRSVEKWAREAPGIRLTCSDAIRTCLHRRLQEEIHELETMNNQAAMARHAKGNGPRQEEA
jgi:hypothetical protein